MKAILSALREIYGLFVEDGSYTIAILAWLIVAAFILPRFVAPSLLAPLLFAGLALLLFENVNRTGV